MIRYAFYDKEENEYWCFKESLEQLLEFEECTIKELEKRSLERVRSLKLVKVEIKELTDLTIFRTCT